MLVIRDVFQAKYGRGDELVALFKEGRDKFSDLSDHLWHVMTDASGPFFTVVEEMQAENLAEYEQLRERLFQSPGFSDWFAKMVPLVESGRREFYYVMF